MAEEIPYGRVTQNAPPISDVHIVWITAGLSCDGDTIPITAATQPGFPYKFMPFMDEPPGARLSTGAVGIYGAAVRSLRSLTHNTVNKEPKWRHRGTDLTTGYKPKHY